MVVATPSVTMRAVPSGKAPTPLSASSSKAAKVAGEVFHYYFTVKGKQYRATATRGEKQLKASEAEWKKLIEPFEPLVAKTFKASKGRLDISLGNKGEVQLTQGAKVRTVKKAEMSSAIRTFKATEVESAPSSEPKKKKAADPKPGPGPGLRTLTTKGDGACALHALLGEDQGGTIQFQAPAGQDPGAAVRAQYVAKLQEGLQDAGKSILIHTMFAKLLEDYLSPSNANRHLKTIFEPLAKELNDLRAKISGIETEEVRAREARRTLIQEQLCQSRDGVTAGKLSALEGYDRLKTPKQQIDYLLNMSEGLPNLFDSEPFPGQCKALNKQLGDLDNQRRDLYAKFIEGDAVQKAYFAAASRPGYWLSTAELELAAHLFDKHVTLHGARGEVFEFNTRARDHAHISHSGGHFERCLPPT